MQILHYIPTTKDNDLTTTYVFALLTAMNDIAETRLVKVGEPLTTIIEAWKPSIIHVHACWNYKAAKAINTAIEKGVAVVVSPHWGLDSYTLRNEHHIEKFSKRILYQQEAVKKADALVVTTKEECKDILKLGWQNHIGIVKSSLLTSITPRQMAEEMLQFYHKVLDTRYFTQMSPNEKEAICSLLHAGASHETGTSLLNSNQILNLRSLNPKQWRRILLYADDEDIRDIIDHAVKQMQLNMPNFDTTKIDRFALDRPKSTDGLKRNEKPKKLLSATYDEEVSLRMLCSMLIDAKWHLKNGTLSMRHMAELYEQIKYKDFDEDRFKALIKQLGIKKFTSGILQILQEHFYLEEGFLPTEPCNNKQATAIRRITIH